MARSKVASQVSDAGDQKGFAAEDPEGRARPGLERRRGEGWMDRQQLSQL
jgi:hypothetical protein